jgi:hypothetical protein
MKKLRNYLLLNRCARGAHPHQRRDRVQCLDIHVRHGCPVWGGAARGALPKAVEAARSAAENGTTSGDAWAAAAVGVDMLTGGERATHGGGLLRPQIQPPPRPLGTLPAVHGARAGPRWRRSWTAPWYAWHWSYLWGSGRGGARQAPVLIAAQRKEASCNVIPARRWFSGAPRSSLGRSRALNSQHQWRSSAGGAHRPRPRLGINAWKKSAGMGAAARGSGRRGGWFTKQLGKPHEIVPIARKTEDSREGSRASSTVKIVLPPMLNPTAHEKMMWAGWCIRLIYTNYFITT